MRTKSLYTVAIAALVFGFAFGLGSHARGDPDGPYCAPSRCAQCSCCKVNGVNTYDGGIGIPCVEHVCIPEGGCDPLP